MRLADIRFLFGYDRRATAKVLDAAIGVWAPRAWIRMPPSPRSPITLGDGQVTSSYGEELASHGS